LLTNLLKGANGNLDLAITNWVDWLGLEFKIKDFYDVPKMPHDDHEVKHPYDELVAMRGTDEGIVVIQPGKE